MLVRGGQGTAEDYLRHDHINFCSPNARVHCAKILEDMMEAKYKNTALERYREEKKSRDKKRTYPEEPQDNNASLPETSQDTNGSLPDEPIIRKKRVSVQEVMSEQQMFQEEHLKLAQRVISLQHRVQNQGMTIKRLASLLLELTKRFEEHASLGLSGVTTAESTTSSLGAHPEILIWDSTEDPDCNCPDNLDCPVHPKK